MEIQTGPGHLEFLMNGQETGWHIAVVWSNPITDPGLAKPASQPIKSMGAVPRQDNRGHSECVLRQTLRLAFARQKTEDRTLANAIHGDALTSIIAKKDKASACPSEGGFDDENALYPYQPWHLEEA